MKQNYLKNLFCGVICAGLPFVATAQEARIGTTDYATVAEAFAAAADGETITLTGDVAIAGMIPVTESVTLDLAGHTITNNVQGNRLFRLSGVTFTIEGNNGKVITPAENTKSYGFVDFRDAANVAHPGTTLIASDVYFEGATDDGGCFMIRGNDQNISFTDVDVTLNDSRTWSIINANLGKGVFKIKGGTYNYTSTVATTGPFQFTYPGGGSEVELDGVTVVSNAGPVMEVVKGKATVTDCKMTNTATNSYYVACVAASNGSDITIKGGEYTSAVPVYVYTSGGTINIDGGTFNGTKAAVQVDYLAAHAGDRQSVVNISDGTFNGEIVANPLAEVKVNEATELVKTVDGQGKTVYMALPKDSDIAAFVGTTPYKTIAEAFAAAGDGDRVVVFKDLDVTEMIPVTKSVTLDLAGHTLTNNVQANRLFRLSGVTFTIEGNNGKVITPAENTKSYGFVDFRDAANVAHPGTTLIASDVYFEGATDDGGCFMIRGNDQNISFTDVDVTLNDSRTWSIINANLGKGVFKIKGGTYNYTSTVATTGPFQFTYTGGGSEVELDGVTVVSNAGPIMEVVKGKATVTDCKMTNTATNSYFVACIAASNGSEITIKGGEYTSAVPVYVYTSGGTINIDGGTFNGTTAAVQVDYLAAHAGDRQSVVNVTSGTFNGNLKVDNNALLSLKGGVYTDKNAGNYVADGYHLEANEDGSYGVVSGVVGIVDAENGSIIPADSKVYNLQGVVVADGLEGLGTLPAGLYIVAGRKVIVK